MTGDDLPEVTVTSTTSPRPQAHPPLKMQQEPQETHPRRSSDEIETPGETEAEGVTESGADRKEKGGGDPELTGDKTVGSKVATNIAECGDGTGAGAGAGGKKREGIERELLPEGFVPAEEMETFDFSALQR